MSVCGRNTKYFHLQQIFPLKSDICGTGGHEFSSFKPPLTCDIVVLFIVHVIQWGVLIGLLTRNLSSHKGTLNPSIYPKNSGPSNLNYRDLYILIQIFFSDLYRVTGLFAHLYFHFNPFSFIPLSVVSFKCILMLF